MKIQIKLSKCIFQPKKGIWSSQVVKFNIDLTDFLLTNETKA